MEKRDLETLRPLLESLPRHGGDTFIEGFQGGTAICLACGATDDMVMIRRHNDGCLYTAHWNAVKALQALLDA